jgi:FKBP-type peptidyl-prolyl cis-trans isomerase
MSKGNTIRQQRRQARAARRRKQRIAVGAFFGLAVVLVAFLAFQSFQQPAESTNVPSTSELQITEVSPGSGPAAQTGDTVSVHYTGRLEDGTVFDSSEGRDPFTFTLGQGNVIQGWEQGILGMQTGQKRVLVIPPDLAYGPAGRPPTIPQNATLIFDVELVEIAGKSATE